MSAYHPQTFVGNPAICIKGSTGDRTCKNAGGRFCGEDSPEKNASYTCCPGTNARSRINSVCANLPINSFCINGDYCSNGACGHPGTKNIGKICCPSGKTYQINGIGDEYCTGGNASDACDTTEGCGGGLTCGHPDGSLTNPKICCPNGAYLSADSRTYCAREKAGSTCEGNRGCTSGNCQDGVCSDKPKNRTAETIVTIIIVIAIIIFLLIVLYIVSRFV